MNRMLRLGRALIADEKGVTAIEFAICAPIVFLFVLITIELCVDMMIDATLQAATQAAARAGLINVTPATQTRAAMASSIVTNGLAGWLRLPNTTVSIVETSYSSYSNVGTALNTTGLGGFGDVVSYQVTLTTPGITGIPAVLGFSPLVFSRNFLVQNEK